MCQTGNRRGLITLLGRVVVAWPLAARAQQDERMRHIAVFLGLPENNPATISGVQHLRDALAELGWTDGKNVRFTYRYADGNPTRARALSKEIVEAQTDNGEVSMRSFAGDEPRTRR